MQNTDTLETIAEPLLSKLLIEKEKVKIKAQIIRKQKQLFK